MKPVSKPPLITRSSRIRATAEKHKTSGLSIQKILVPTDFSPAGRSAVKYAQYLAQSIGASVALLHVVPCLYYGIPPRSIPREFTTKIEKISHRLESIRKTHFQGIKSEYLLREGSPFEEISRAAQDMRCDLIVMTAHGKKRLRRFFLGGTAEQTIRHASCPVLLLRSGGH